jgi:predicted Zn-dependent peptidase
VLLPLKAKDPYAPAGRSGAGNVAQAEGAVQKTVLANGVTVLITRNTAAPVVSFQLYTLGGLLAENEGNNGIGAAMMELMTRGTQTRTHEQIADFLDRTGTTLGAESGNNSFALSMQCLKDKAGE